MGDMGIIRPEMFAVLQRISFESMQVDQLRVCIHGIRYNAAVYRGQGVAPHRHDFFEFHYITEGEITTVINGVTRHYRAGEYYLMTPLVTHSHAHHNYPRYEHVSFALRFRLEFAPCEHPDPELDRIKVALETASPAPMADEGLEIFHLMERLILLSQRADTQAEQKLTFFSLLCALGRRYRNARDDGRGLADPEAGQKIINAAINYIDAHFAEPLQMADVARFAHVSYSHLSRLFERHVGCPMGVYLTRVRVDRAQHLLLSTDQPVGEMAAQLGFANVSHFSNTFKRTVGLSPSEFRTVYRRFDQLRDPTLL